jgi:hypothetical protein
MMKAAYFSETFVKTYKTTRYHKLEDHIYYIKIYEHGTLVQILRFWTLSIVLSLFKMLSCFSFKTQRFGDWILSPSSAILFYYL